MASHLQLLTLGAPLLLTEAGEQIRFRTRKHFALLIRLAVESGRKLTRDHLMDLLWPNVPTARARHSLAQALSVLREKVGRDQLIVQRTSIALAGDAVAADVVTLDSCETRIRGQFLEGFDVPGAVRFEQWKDEWRAKLMPRIRDCLVKQMDAGRRIGNFEAVEKHAQILLELDPLCEDAVRGVMEARAWVGDRSNALKAYGRFAARLAEELGAKPSPDLVRVADLLREGKRAAPREPGARHVAERHERRFEAETLIGREREFARLYDVWLEVRRREPRIMVVLGDPGVGKTTLVNAFVSTCQMEGAAIARAQAYDAERELPFGVLAELIKQLTLQRAIGGADPEALSELTRVSPEIFTVFPGVPKPVEWSPEVVPLRLADAFLKAVEAAAEESPLVLVVDDIHATDNASVAILHAVARKLPRARLFVIVTARSSELRMAEDPSAFVADSRIEALRTLELEPLPPAAAERLVTVRVAKAEVRVEDVPVARILQAGNGNPLALELLTKEWIAHGSSSLLSDLDALNTQPVANLGIPRAIGAVFERQIRRLDAPTRAVLDLAAVLGRRLADLPLYEVVELSPALAGEALSRLREEGLLREVQGGMEFRNELIRAQAYYAVAGPARQYLHRRVGNVLAARLAKRSDEGAGHLEVAWHFLRGGDATHATRTAISGAEAALRVGAPLEAEQILSVLIETGTPEATPRLRFLLTRALLQQSKAEVAAPNLAILSEEGMLSAMERAEVASMQAATEYLLHREPGLAYCKAADTALSTARETGDRELIGKALFEYARSGVTAGDNARVTTARREAHESISQGGDAAPPILFYTKAYCDFFFHELRSAATELETAVDLLLRSRDHVLLALAYTGYGTCRHGLCEFERAYESFLKALDLTQKIGDDARTATIMSNLCALKLHVGQYEAAIRFGELGVRLGTAASTSRLPTIYLNLATAMLMGGRKDDAIQSLNAALRESQNERSWLATMEFLLGHASVALMLGDTPAALEIIRSAERLAAGKEIAVPNGFLFDKLRVFRTVHVAGVSPAQRIVAESRDKYCGRFPFAYLQVVASAAWLDRLSLGRHSEQNELELRLFDRPDLKGMREILTVQGFLPSRVRPA